MGGWGGISGRQIYGVHAHLTGARAFRYDDDVGNECGNKNDLAQAALRLGFNHRRDGRCLGDDVGGWGCGGGVAKLMLRKRSESTTELLGYPNPPLPHTLMLRPKL